MEPVIYCRRRGLIPGGEREWRVETDALVTRGASGRERRLAWRDVASVRLYADPARGRPWRYVFEIQPKQGPRITIDNAHFVERSVYENRSAAYTLFVRAALAQIAQENPRVRALLAETQKRYFFLLLAGLLSFCTLALALIAPTPLDNLAFGGLIKLMLILVMLPAFAFGIIRALPRGIPLDEVPERAFPPNA
ncbi:MAG: hypothetical protein NW206_01555 [Hyphomonadaceae bacterium]|nr:hypothetical protein [Hyphomonadaceae bacterium]